MLAPIFEAERELLEPLTKYYKQITAGLIGGLAGGLILPMMLTGQMPKWAKTLCLSTSLGCGAALTTLAFNRSSQRHTEYTGAIDRAQKEVLDASLQHEVGLHKAAQKMLTKHKLKELILQMPVEEALHWLNYYKMADLTPSEYYGLQQVIDVPAQSVGDSTVNIPHGLMEQQTLQDAIQDGVELSVDWFRQWERRSGIVCGESGDGKTKLLLYVLAQFLNRVSEEFDGKGKVYICDPDYGSSHGDEPPNTWYNLPLDKVIFIKPESIYAAVELVSKEVDRRADETAIAVSKGQSKPQFEPILLIVDEAPNINSALHRLSSDKADNFVGFLSNILRRGLKQGVTFKIGTQTLAVGTGKGGLGIPQDILRQVEVVMLYRASQVKENYKNLGIRDGLTDVAVDQISSLPKQVGDRFCCVTFLEKQLAVQGIPMIGKFEVQHPTSTQDVHTPLTVEKLVAIMQDWVAKFEEFPDDSTILGKLKELTGKDFTKSGLEAIKSAMQNNGVN